MRYYIEYKDKHWKKGECLNALMNASLENMKKYIENKSEQYKMSTRLVLHTEEVLHKATYDNSKNK